MSLIFKKFLELYYWGIELFSEMKSISSQIKTKGIHIVPLKFPYLTFSQTYKKN